MSDLPHQLTECEGSSITISWSDLEYSIDGKLLLCGLTGCALPSRTLAVMGPSGAGKSLLLNAIGNRLSVSNKAILSGDILLNDVPFERDFQQIVGFVPQEDVLGSTQTPESAMSFTLRVRRGKSRAETRKVVDEMIETLKLTKARHTTVGVPGIASQLSGGERKRTNVGVELVVDTKLLLLDDPTSGLDSSTATSLLKTLHAIAQRGRTVIYTLQQPTLAMVKEVDDVLFIAEGQVTYHGPMDCAERYFEAVGFPCPATYNITDHVVGLLQNPDSSKYLIAIWQRYLDLNGLLSPIRHTEPVEWRHRKRSIFKFGSSAIFPRLDTKTRSLAQLDEANNGSPVAETPMGRIMPVQSPVDTQLSDEQLVEALQPAPDSLTGVQRVTKLSGGEMSATRLYIQHSLSQHKSSLSVQAEELLRRSFRETFCDRSMVTAIIAQYTLIALIFAAVFRNLTDDVTGVQDRMGLLFMVSFGIAFSSTTTTVNRFSPYRSIFIREQSSNSYSPALYFFTKFFWDSMLFLLCGIFYMFIVYFICKLYLSAGAFFTAFAAIQYNIEVAILLGYLCSIVIANNVTASSVIPLLNIPLMLVSGLVANNSKIRPYWYWLEKLSWIRYCFIILCHNEFDRIKDIHCDPAKYGEDYCLHAFKNGAEVLHYFEFDDKQDQPWVMWLQFVAMSLLLTTLCLISIYRVGRGKS